MTRNTPAQSTTFITLIILLITDPTTSYIASPTIILLGLYTLSLYIAIFINRPLATKELALYIIKKAII